MLSVPIGVAGNITQFMTTCMGAKGGSQSIRPGTPLLLSQVWPRLDIYVLRESVLLNNENLLFSKHKQRQYVCLHLHVACVTFHVI